MKIFFVMFKWGFLPVLIFVAACQSSQPEPVSAEGEPAAAPAHRLMMRSLVDYLRIRSSPERESEVSGSLREGEAVLWTGEQSDILDTVDLRGKRTISPWYAIETTSGLKGWVFGGALEAWSFGPGLPYATCVQAYNRGDFATFYPCLDGVAQQVSGPEKVSAGPSGLVLKLDGGRSLRLENRLTPGEDYLAYQYLGAVGSVYVVKVNGIKGSGFLVVDRTTGEQLEVPGIPQPIPMTRGHFCLGTPPEQPGTPILTVVDTGDRRIREVFRQDFPGQSLVGIRWETDGLPLVTLRDNRGDLSSWKLVRGEDRAWQLDRSA